MLLKNTSLIDSFYIWRAENEYGKKYYTQKTELKKNTQKPYKQKNYNIQLRYIKKQVFFSLDVMIYESYLF